MIPQSKPVQNRLKISILLMFLSLALYYISTFLMLPDSITVASGMENKLNFNCQATAVFKASGSFPEIRINNRLLSGSVKLNMKEEMTISSQEQATADMTVKALGIPLKNVTIEFAETKEIIPCGVTVGVRIDTDGILVLGTGYVNSEDGISHKPAEGALMAGDLILSVNGVNVKNKEALYEEINKASGDAELVVSRNSGETSVSVTPVKAAEDDKKKIGVWVRDSTQGLGTITYVNPETMKFGALGHGIMDVDTKKLMSIKDGTISAALISSVKKGRKGSPGELIGDIKTTERLGSVNINNSYGIYGTVDDIGYFDERQALPIALQNDVTEGPAIILSNIADTSVTEYEVCIETVNKFSSDESKGMVIRITDEDLLSKTGGIVQGMSGSPIIQNGKIVGAITHVFVQEPTKGYGIFIENMLKQESMF